MPCYERRIYSVKTTLKTMVAVIANLGLPSQSVHFRASLDGSVTRFRTEPTIHKDRYLSASEVKDMVVQELSRMTILNAATKTGWKLQDANQKPKKEIRFEQI